jgi:hypothetical protein
LAAPLAILVVVVMIHGKTLYGECRSDEDGYYLLLVAVVRRAMQDSKLRPERYKRPRDQREFAGYKQTAKEFIALARK